MAREKSDGGTPRALPPQAAGAASESIEMVLDRVSRQLEAGHPERALEEIGRCKLKSDRLTNAAAVCQMRLGNAERAVEALRGLVIEGSIHLRADVPPVYKLNFAAALLAAGNVDGFLTTLAELGDGHPSARRYRDAYRTWRASLTRWERVKAGLFGMETRPFRPEFPLGELS